MVGLYQYNLEKSMADNVPAFKCGPLERDAKNKPSAVREILL